MTERPVVVGPRLRRLLIIVLLLFALLAINSIYLIAVTLIEWLREISIQNFFYQWMFLGHLVLGLLLVLPAVAYGLLHFRNARSHRNRRAVKVGYALFATALLLLATGLMLTRGLPWVELRDPDSRLFAYWLHVSTPIVLVWLFILHRLAGKPIRWRSGVLVVSLASLISLLSIVIQSQDPRRWNQAGPASAEQYFLPSLARTADGNFIGSASLMMDEYCAECHQDVHSTWAQSMHRFSSFNNPAYAFSVGKTRDFLQQRDGNNQGVRFCAGCHDPVPFFSGAMDQMDFEHPDDPVANAGITCSVCHSITHVNSTRGNADYTIEEPLHYPFAYSQQPWLQWINQTLVKAKPAFHKKTFLKPLHSSAEFCSTCHKVHIPEQLNDYRWLRGQNHYDSYLLSGVSGHGVQSFYYPDKAEENCNGCHMSLMPSEDFGAKRYEANTELSVHDHQFPAANTAIPHLLNMPERVNQAQRKALQNIVRVDIFGIREAGRIDGKLSAPLNSRSGSGVDPGQFVVQPGKQYLLEVVVRTLKLGHHFTQGTADSNQVWLNLVASTNGEAIGESGALDSGAQRVDSRAHFLNAYVIDRQGRRIDRRNPENIFTSLYNNQIPPGASDVVHYLLTVPETDHPEIDIEVSLKYRKFDTRYLQYILGDQFEHNDLPITVMATDRVRLRVGDQPLARDKMNMPLMDEFPLWQRWNDYGIGLLRRHQFRQAEKAFKKVESSGRGVGALNLARVYLQEGRLAESADALTRAASAEFPAPNWSISYFTAQLNLQNGYFDEAIEGLGKLVNTQFPAARERGFNFAYDYRMLNDLALAFAERAKLERGPDAVDKADVLRRQAVKWYQQALQLDAENVTAHYGLAQLYQQLGDEDAAVRHRRLHQRYKIDDNAKDQAVQLARKRDAAADLAANRVVIYHLQPAQSSQQEAP
ncbi:MAG: tetratricopeptide repeat protein [Arenicella sp.]|nr:tetratricopeptide repeat protein [Arenicella sp.]